MNRFIACPLAIGLSALSICAAVSSADAPEGKLSLPDAGARAQEMKLVDDVYKDQIAKAHTQAEKTALATDLIRQAGETKEKAAEQFALYSKAGDIAAQAGDATTALAAVDILARRFEVDALALHADMLAKLINALSQASTQKIFIEHCDAAMDDAVAQERYDLVKRVGDLEILAAKKYGDANSLKSANARSAEMHAARIAFDKQKTAMAALGRNPADPAANFAVGSYQCFIREDWKTGLPFLAKGNDPAIKTLAQQELAASSDAQARTTLADGWWDRAAKERGLAQKHIQRHAATLYADALPSLTGLAKTKVENRIASLSTAGVSFGARAMTLDEVLTRFTFPNKSFHLAGDAITGNTDDSGDASKYVWLTNPETMQSFEYGFSMKAKWYQNASIDIDGDIYGFCRGCWGNGETNIYIRGKKEEHVPGKVKNATEYDSIKVVLSENKLTYFYNGAVAGTCDLLKPATPATRIKVGFTSHSTLISVKDVYLVEK